MRAVPCNVWSLREKVPFRCTFEADDLARGYVCRLGAGTDRCARLILTTVLLFSCNYMDMQEKIGMIKKSRGLVRVLLVAFMDFLIIVSYLVIFTAFLWLM